MICNVTPTQLYGVLLDNVSPQIKQRSNGYRYGRAGMQIHFALSAPPPWCNPELLHVPLVHFTESMEQVCLSVLKRITVTYLINRRLVLVSRQRLTQAGSRWRVDFMGSNAGASSHLKR